jgi:hypothetical protein
MKLGQVWPPGRVLLALIMLVGVAFTLGGATLVAQQEPTFWVNPDLTVAPPGTTFTLSVDVADAVDMVGYQFMLDFDPDIVELSNPEDGGFLESAPDCTIAGGTATCTALDMPPYNGGADGAGTLVQFDAEIVGRGVDFLLLHDAQASDVESEVVVPTLEGGVVDSAVWMWVVPSFAGRAMNVGTTFTEEVMIENARDMAAFEFKMDFDPDVVQVQDVDTAPGVDFLESLGRTVDPGLINVSYDNDAGTIFVAAASVGEDAGPTGDGVLAEITFDAVAPGDTVLALHDGKVYDTTAMEELPFGYLNGLIHVVDEGIQVVPMHSEVFEEETFSVDIDVGDADDLAGFQFNMAYDQTVVNVTDVELGPFLTDVVSTTENIDNDLGLLLFGAFALEGQTADVGTLATVHFTALEVDEDETSLLDIFGTEFYNSEADLTLPVETDGDVLVKNCVPASIDSLEADSSVELPTALGDPVSFMAEVSGSEPITYDWDFGGDGTATGEDTATPTFTYDAVGTYTVTLTAENCGGPVQETVVVSVCDPVTVVDVDTDSPVELGETMHFTATVTGTPPFGYSWDFGDGTQLGPLDVNVASHDYTETGTYTVTVTAGNCSLTVPFLSMMSVEVEVTEPVFELFMPIIAKNFSP